MYPLRNYRAHSIILYSPACEARSARVVVADLVKRYGEETDLGNVLALEMREARNPGCAV